MIVATAATKHKLVGRIAFAKDPKDSQVYWKCPARGCATVHYFGYQTAQSGLLPVYKYQCTLCSKKYIASQLHVTGTAITLVVVFEEK
jgi:hypothetical protein